MPLLCVRRYAALSRQVRAAGSLEERSVAGSSRKPLCLASRTRTIWRYWSVPSLSGLLSTQTPRSKGFRLPSASTCPPQRAQGGDPQVVGFEAGEAAVYPVRWGVLGSDSPFSWSGSLRIVSREHHLGYEQLVARLVTASSVPRFGDPPVGGSQFFLLRRRQTRLQPAVNSILAPPVVDSLHRKHQDQLTVTPPTFQQPTSPRLATELGWTSVRHETTPFRGSAPHQFKCPDSGRRG